MASRRQSLTYTFNAETGQFERQTKKVQQGFAGLKSSFAKASLAAAAAGLAIQKTTEAVVEFTERGSRVIGVRKSFEAIAEDYEGILAASRRATKGMVSDFDLMQVANKGILLGLPITANEMEILGKTAISLGRAMDVGPTQAMQDLITGLGRGSPAILDNLGITVKAQDAYRQYAASIGKSSNELTDSEKKLAVYKAAMTAANEQVAKMGEVTLTAGDEVHRLGAEWQNLKDEMAASVAQSTVLTTVIQNMTKAIRDWRASSEQWSKSQEGTTFWERYFTLEGHEKYRKQWEAVQKEAFDTAMKLPEIAVDQADLWESSGLAADAAARKAEANKALKEQKDLYDQNLEAAEKYFGAQAAALEGRVQSDWDEHLDALKAAEEAQIALSQATEDSAFNDPKLAALEETHTENLKGVEEGLIKAKEASIDWSRVLQDVANQMIALGGAGETLGQLMGGLAGGLASFDTFKAGREQGGLRGALGMLSGGLGIASAAIGIGKAIVGLFKADPVEKAQEEAGRQLGMVVSEQMADEFLRQAEQTGQSVAQVAQQWFDDMRKALREEGMAQAMSGLQMQVAALQDVPEYADVAARNFNAIFWETVRDQGLPAALDAFESIFSQLRAAFGDELPPGFERLETLFGLMSDPQIKARLQFAQGQAQFVTGATKAGFYDPSLTQDSVNIARDTLANLRDQGVDDKAAYQMIGGLLQAELNAALASGREIDSGLQALLDEARANGVQILPDIAAQQLDILRKIYTELSGKPAPIPGVPPGAPAPPGGGGGGSTSPKIPERPPGYPPGKPWPPEMDAGGVVMGPVKAMIGERRPEVVMPLGQLSQIGPELASLRQELPRAIARAVRDGMAQARGG